MSITVSTWTFSLDRLERFADYLLNTVVAVFDAAGVELPVRRLITVGTPIHDGEALVLTFQGLSKGLPGGAEEAQRCDSPTSGVFEVHLIRCFPTGPGRGKAPEADALTNNAIGLMRDAWLLMAAAETVASDPLGAPFGIITSVTMGDPQGGLVGMSLRLETAVP